MSFGLGFGFPKSWSSVASAPTLSLNFVGANALPANITFSRTTAATQFDSLGRLVWAPMNLLLQTSDFSNATWVKTRASVSPSTGINVGTPYFFVEDTTPTTTHSILQGVALVAGVTYRYSVYAKTGGRSIALQMPTASFSGVTGPAFFDLSSGTVGVTGGATASITLVSPGVYRCAVVATCATAGAGNFITYLTSGGSNVYTGDGASGAIISAAQLEYAAISGATSWNATTSAAYYGPRFDYNPATLAARGLLVEESRTNSVVNSTMVGGTAPSTVPTGWNISAVTGLTITYAYGTEDGIPYIDVTYSGTNTSGADAFPTIFAGTIAGAVAAANGQTWTGSLYVRKIAGTTAISTINYFVRGRASGTLVPGQSSGVALADSAKLTTGRVNTTFTFTDPTITHVEQVVSTTVANGAAYDITLRIGGPQLEQGQIATSPTPTYGVAATRGTDQVTIAGTNFSAWYNQAGGTVVCAGTVSTPDPLNARRWWDISDGTANNRIQQGRASGGSMFTQSVSTVAGVSDFAPITAGSVGSFQYTKAAYMFSAAGKRLVRDNGAVASNVVVPPTSGMTQMVIGGLAGFFGGNCFNGWIGSIAYYPKTDFTDAQLQALTV